MAIGSELTCVQCQQGFVQKSPGREPKYCGAACRNRASHERAKADGRYAERLAKKPSRRKPEVATLCPYCLQLFGAVSEKVAHCGTDKCRKRHRAAYMRPIANRRRAAKQRPGADAIDPIEIFIRDGWICWLCKIPVDPLAAPRSPGSASLDHIIPLSKGGAHTRSNVKCAHLRCNMAKGAKIAA
jgi:5-methylcytosine-specific restriction endonuclease McrA